MTDFYPGSELYLFCQRTMPLMRVEFTERQITITTDKPFTEDEKRKWLNWYAMGWPSKQVVWE